MALGILVEEIKCFQFVTWSQKNLYLKDYLTLQAEAPYSNLPSLMARGLVAVETQHTFVSNSHGGSGDLMF